MRFTILTIGSRGDVEPSIALGIELQRAGHVVQLATHVIFKTIIRNLGLEFTPVEGNFRELLEGQAGQEWLESGQNPFRFTLSFSSVMQPVMERVLADSWSACQQAEAIIFTPLAFWGYDIAQKLNIPCFLASPVPLSRTSAFPHPVTPPKVRLGNTYNWFTYVFVEQLLWLLFQKSINRWRQTTLSLPPMPQLVSFNQTYLQRVPSLFGYSSAVVPKPTDWSDWFHVTGYWFLDSSPDWQPSYELVNFIKAGSAPVYVGFGSMMGRNPVALTELVLKSLLLTGRRGILQMGWGGLSNIDLPDWVFPVESIPHNWLFPQVAAVVHHGGAGTTGASLRAGIPSIIAPFLGDQFFWGERVARLGVGTEPIPQKQLNPERLAAAIHTATHDKAMQRNATILGEQIRKEDGLARGVEIIQNHLKLD